MQRNHAALFVVCLLSLFSVACANLAATDARGTTSAPSAGDGIAVPTETYSLPNGMTVVLHEDHALPKVVINTWFAVGSKDEAPGRTGFAHLFEHLMFMGTERVPDNQFDVLMERGGGSNNASTSNDRTNYFSMGPSSLLPTLLWLDADRLDALPDSMTQEKLDRQRDVVRNERRQNTENVPYGKGRLLLPKALYPAGHPYHHSVIGSHEDLEAATLQDVIDFFHEFYVPANASLVVAGDFDSAEVKQLIARTFGAIPAKPLPARRTAPPVALDGETRIVDADQVQFAKLTLAWHSPGFYRPGDAEMDLIGSILSDGPSSRLERLLVQELELAQSVRASQGSRELGSTFQIDAIAAPGADLEEIKHLILRELDELAQHGPTQRELARAQAQREAGFLRGNEGLLSRADSINAYRHFFGTADGFQRDLDRYLNATPERIRHYASEVFGPGRVDLRIFPLDATTDAASLDERPADFAPSDFAPVAPTTFELSNGVPVHVVARPGTRLFSGALVARGGELLVSNEQAGLASLAAELLNAGAGGLDRNEFAQAVESIGASVRAFAGRRDTSVYVDGLSSRMDETLDLFADLVLRPNWTEADFALEQQLTVSSIRARADNPNAVASLIADTELFGRDDPRGRPADGTVETVGALTSADIDAIVPRLLAPDRAAFVFVGDFDVDALKHGLNARFGSWKSTGDVKLPDLTPLTKPAPGRMVLVHRPDAPQTVIRIVRPLASLEGAPRQARFCIDTVFGGTFTSRLNGNLREDKGYTYGAGSRVSESGDQTTLLASSAVRTDVTGASLVEFKREFDAMAANGVDSDELSKARETLRANLVEDSETNASRLRSLTSLVRNGRAIDETRADLAALGQLDLTATNAQATSGTYAWDDLLVVLVGDRTAIVPQLEAAGLGTPVELDPSGAVRSGS